jgi:hypothetical protein
MTSTNNRILIRAISTGGKRRPGFADDVKRSIGTKPVAELWNALVGAALTDFSWPVQDMEIMNEGSFIHEM